MNPGPSCRTFAVIGIGVLLVLFATAATADDVRPVQILVKELPSGDYDIKWSVPKVIRPQSMPSPRLPDGCSPVGERTFIDQPSTWLTRQVYHCPSGLAGQTLGVDFPLYNIGLSTLIRVEFLSGDRYAHLLAPGEDTWRVPEVGGDDISRRLLAARGVLASGARHFFGGWVHLAFLLVICLLGDARIRVRLATAFLLGQAGAVLVGTLTDVRLDIPLAEIGVAIATVLMAREALRLADKRRQITVLVACAGVAHGLGAQNFVSLPGQDEAPSVLASLVFVLGMDAAFLFSAMVVSGLGRIAWRLPGRIRIARTTAYGVAGISLALAFGAVVDGPVAKEAERKLQLPSMMTPSGVTALPGSRRVASKAPDAAIQSFIAIEAFEVRHEILVRLRDVADLIGIGPGPELAIEGQSGVKERVRELVLARALLTIDGTPAEPGSQRVDFVTLDQKGVLPRPEPVSEFIETAWIGVTAAYLTPTMARDLTLAWEFVETMPEIPATVTDPEFSVTASLTMSEPVLRWTNELTEDPVPKVSAITIEPTMYTVPFWSLALLAAALFFAGAATLRRQPALSTALTRAMLVFAIILGPFGNVAVALPWSANSAPGATKAKRILARILPNVYRALEFREESAVFDQLALSVQGETLSKIYLDHREVLEMEERGGARARVEAVEVIDVDSVAPERAGGFSARAAWTVGGTVTHFGHRHFRQNRYDAWIVVAPDQDIWKLQSIEILDEQRVR